MPKKFRLLPPTMFHNNTHLILQVIIIFSPFFLISMKCFRSDISHLLFIPKRLIVMWCTRGKYLERTFGRMRKLFNRLTFVLSSLLYVIYYDVDPLKFVFTETHIAPSSAGKERKTEFTFRVNSHSSLLNWLCIKLDRACITWCIKAPLLEALVQCVAK